MVDDGRGITIVPVLDNPAEEAFGMFAGKTSLTQALLAERAKERVREER